jgi:hypothetical protein
MDTAGQFFWPGIAGDAARPESRFQALELNKAR